MIKFANIISLTILTTTIVTFSIFTFGIMPNYLIKIALAEDAANKSGKDNVSTTTSAINTIPTTNNTAGQVATNLSIKEVSDGVYKWINASNSATKSNNKGFHKCK